MKKKLTDNFIRNYPPPDKRVEIVDTYINGLILRITPTGRKTFSYRYRIGNSGKYRRKTIGRYPTMKLSKAREEVRELSYQVMKGNDPTSGNSKSATVGEVCDQFKQKHFPSLRKSTQEHYRHIIDKEILPVLGDMDINLVSKSDILSMLDDKAFGDNSPTMANRIRSRLGTVFNFAINRGLADNNPVLKTNSFKEGKTRRDRFYSICEIRKLWNFFDRWQEPVTGNSLKMLLICGQRKTETLVMKWDDLDLDNNIWTIPAERAKNGNTHDVPLSSMALSVLDTMSDNGPDYVFQSPNKDNTPISSLSRVRQRIQKDLIEDFRPHDLRRTVATYLGKLGVSRTVTGKILNHKGLSGDSSTTAIYDRHSYMDEKRRALQRWSSHLDKIISGKSLNSNIVNL